MAIRIFEFGDSLHHLVHSARVQRVHRITFQVADGSISVIISRRSYSRSMDQRRHAREAHSGCFSQPSVTVSAHQVSVALSSETRQDSAALPAPSLGSTVRRERSLPLAVTTACRSDVAN